MIEAGADGFHRCQHIVMGDGHELFLDINLDSGDSLDLGKGFLNGAGAAAALDVGGGERGICHAPSVPIVSWIVQRASGGL